MQKLIVVIIMKKILIIGLIFMVSSCAATFKSGLNALGVKIDDRKHIKLDIKPKILDIKIVLSKLEPVFC
jgi:hypothetical protein